MSAERVADEIISSAKGMADKDVMAVLDVLNESGVDLQSQFAHNSENCMVFSLEEIKNMTREIGVFEESLAEEIDPNLTSISKKGLAIKTDSNKPNNSVNINKQDKGRGI